jgi:flagellar protein FlaJ
MKRETKVYISSIILASICLLIGILSGISGVMGNALILVVLILTIPFIFFQYEKYRRIRDMEEKFPHFLRDLTESIRSGMPLTQAIRSAAKMNYGRFLTPEIRKIANQISWGMPLNKALDQFAERVKRSKRLNAATRIIKEAYFSGGDVASILNSIAETTTLLREAEREKKSILNQYVVLMYGICIVFLVIVVVVTRFILPIFETEMGMEEAGLMNPCEVCRGILCNSICSFYSFIAKSLLRLEAGPKAYYVSLFFLMAIIQASFAGVIIGEMTEKSIIVGLRHSVILAGISWGVFLILIQMGMLG